VRGLVLYGEHEAGFVKRQALALAVALRDGTVREIPDAGHAANVDNPAGFTAAVRAFLPAAAPEPLAA
jgi:pimeloyl-ACP methyl ester carboxylesterase